MSKKSSLTTDDVRHLGKLANLDLSDKEIKKYTEQLEETLEFVKNLSEIDQKDFGSKDSATSLVNLRQDKIDSSRTISPSEALNNAKKTNNNYFVVPKVLNNE